MKIKLRNRLEVLMKDSGVKSFEEMAQRLQENQGVSLSRTSVSRKFRDEDPSLSLSFIAAVCNELQCLPGDLFETEVSEATEEFVSDLRSRVQPFRYGVLRLGEAPPERVPEAERQNPKPKGKARPEASPPQEASDPASVDLDKLLGPRVTHLSAQKLKKP